MKPERQSRSRSTATMEAADGGCCTPCTASSGEAKTRRRPLYGSGPDQCSATLPSGCRTAYMIPPALSARHVRTAVSFGFRAAPSCKPTLLPATKLSSSNGKPAGAIRIAPISLILVVTAPDRSSYELLLHALTIGPIDSWLSDGPVSSKK